MKVHLSLLPILAICACTIEPAFPEVPEEPAVAVYTGMIEQPTRTSLDKDYGILWSSSDAVSLFQNQGSRGTQFIVSSTSDDGKTAEFTGPAASEGYLYALYPASSEAVLISEEGQIQAGIPTVQKGVLESFPVEGCLSMAQVGDDGVLRFRNACALLSFLVPGNYITRVKIESVDIETAMTGPAVISWNSGIPLASPGSQAKNYVEVEVPPGSAGKRYYACVYPGNYGSGFRVSFYADRSYNRYTSNKPLVLERSAIVRLIEKNWTVLDDRYKSESGTELIEPVISAGGPSGDRSAYITFSCASGKRDGYKLYRRIAASRGQGTLVETMHTGSGQFGSFTYVFINLTGGLCYDFGVSAICTSGSGFEDSPITWLEDVAVSGDSSGLYPWETARAAVAEFADISLITLGQHNSNPPSWTTERFTSHVCYTDKEGTGHWLFDAFLCSDTFDRKRSMSYCIGNSYRSATKDSWEDLLESWLGSNGALKTLDEAISDAATRLGPPPCKRLVVMAVPDPIMFSNFTDKSSSTTYWGDIEGVATDFSRVSDQKEACRWYMDRCRERFSALGFKNLELAGFYILSEELHLSSGFYSGIGESCSGSETWNSQYKRWEEIIPYLASYAHSCNEGLWWIPYNQAPGHRVWQKLGIDFAFMQPNHYWDHDSVQHSISEAASVINRYGMGMELEFEYSMVASVMADGRSGPDGSGNPVFYLKDVPMLRERLSEYMDACQSIGIYGKKPIAVYSGTDAMHQLAVSTEAGDVETYHKLCSYIINSPLKKK